MLGYGKIAPHYPLTFPHALASAGYVTTSLGKDHFGWNTSTDSGVAHGYQKTDLYDGLGHWNASEPHSWAEPLGRGSCPRARPADPLYVGQAAVSLCRNLAAVAGVDQRACDSCEAVAHQPAARLEHTG